MAEIKKVLEEEITPTLEKLRAERSQYMQFLNNEQEANKLSRFVAAFEYYTALVGGLLIEFFYG